MTTAEQKAYARKVECEEDGLYYARYFFKQRTGGKMIVAPHHKVIQQTLDRVIDGEIQRLIINVPPGYTKTELATINMMGRGLALNCRARFMHLSYSHNLALLNSSTARGMIKSQAYQSMWPMVLRDDADSKAMWWTEHGGGVYASSAAGQVTGFRAGHMEPGWQGALIIDDPVKPDDAYSEIVRDGVNNRFNETIKSRLAIETTPMIVIMQRIHYHDLSGYLLRGGSGEKWHHLNLPVIIDSSQPYAAQHPENSHAIPIDHGLPDGWLWPFKHNESHRISLFSHRRTAEAQYMQKPRRFNAEGALWTEGMISAARELQIHHDKVRTVVAIDPQATNSDESDETGIVTASSYGAGDKKQFSVDGDYSGKYSPAGWAKKAISAYEQHEADAIVIETNQGGDMAEETLRNAGFKGRIIRVHASKGKYARAEPISALYEQGRVANHGNFYVLENQLMEYIPATAKKSPDRLDAMVYALTELNGSQPVGMMIPKRLR
ncbi:MULTISPECIES: DNA-packaging protein [Enterobacter cloacae complex]|uniref:phage terminase large subunit family protein n=1 Tax=Enterobacter cloacae complex TaxID=354276 RepID=UPI001011B645|nr:MULTISPECIES: DNA-packaging protein [Enterobacter cloacae complex]MEB6420330.1 DNA-packaging protein [Enterobacter hormaechei subsp. xiangfangensis]RYA57632.1 DNA-packaging protein [Enterobacter cloacae complex sp. 4DZ3-28B]RYA77902.1 DNA-packaging protein [Enterobacter cloacae complex sp. 4DZ3-17B2]RYA86256.1 DNA-packaging protein [Enterobacter cloacae complex sp. 4DZ1-17B1]RYA96906.1 DNA-packaging protein [Enterobacter cloacae complex sp. 742-ADZ3-9B]